MPRKGQIKDLVGQRFGKLLVTSYSHNEKYIHFWKVLCDCGKEKTVRSGNIKSGTTSSCGCMEGLGRKVKHGLSNTRINRIHSGMKDRCFNVKNKDYPKYGGRGITVCERWKDFSNFVEDTHESYLDHVDKFGEKNTTLERVDVDKGYNVKELIDIAGKDEYGRKDARLLISLKPSLKGKLSEYAFNNRMSMNEAVRLAVRSLLDPIEVLIEEVEEEKKK